jgi:HSP20 family protein
MHRFFDDYTGDRYTDEDFGTCNCYPVVDIYETAEGYRIEAEMPGVNPDNIEIKLERNTFYLSGDKSAEKDVKDNTVHRTERFSGKFRRSFILPEPVNSDKVKADYKDGILTVHIPKAEEAKPKKIKISS